MNDADKKSFLEEILQYWILSVKEPSGAMNVNEGMYCLCMILITIMK